MNKFSKTYYPDKYNISVVIRRDSFSWMGCRIRIKMRKENQVTGFDHLLLRTFPNDDKMFKRIEKCIDKTDIPKKDVKKIVEDIKRNVMFEKVVTFKPLNGKMSWE